MLQWGMTKFAPSPLGCPIGQTLEMVGSLIKAEWCEYDIYKAAVTVPTNINVLVANYHAVHSPIDPPSFKMLHLTLATPSSEKI